MTSDQKIADVVGIATVKLNLNHSCTVILTQKGADSLNETAVRWNDYFSAKGISHESKQNYTSGDPYRSPLWCLFEQFGKDLHLGGETPFFENGIDIEGASFGVQKTDSEEGVPI